MTSRSLLLISCIVPSILYGLTCSVKPPEADLVDEVFVGMSRGQENLIEELVAKVLLIREELEKLGFCTGWAEIEQMGSTSDLISQLRTDDIRVEMANKLRELKLAAWMILTGHILSETDFDFEKKPKYQPLPSKEVDDPAGGSEEKTKKTGFIGGWATGMGARSIKDPVKREHYRKFLREEKAFQRAANYQRNLRRKYDSVLRQCGRYVISAFKRTESDRNRIREIIDRNVSLPHREDVFSRVTADL